MSESSTQPNLNSAAIKTPRWRETLVFLFLAVVLMPVLSVAVVGGFGFAVWMYQLIVGPPTG